MDVLSHALWGYAVLRWRGPRTARWGLLAGAAPDLLFYIPGLLRQIAQRGLAALTAPVGGGRNIWLKDGPVQPPELIDIYDHYYVLTHSLVLVGVLALVWWLFKRRSVWFLLPVLLHILMDIPTHERYLTPMFFPISGFVVMGYAWSRPPLLIANWIALLVTYLWLFWRYWRPGRPPRTAPWPEDTGA
jgi:membrane-bound metal-dependent hydrolase YbcI (DUF457 family)